MLLLQHRNKLTAFGRPWAVSGIKPWTGVTRWGSASKADNIIRVSITD